VTEYTVPHQATPKKVTQGDSDLILQTLNAIIVAQFEHMQQNQQPRWVVGFSGGIDSTVLLHALAMANRLLATPFPIVAVHVNHQLSPHADVWQRHCQHIAQSLSVECVVMTATVSNEGQGWESAARDARYSLFDDFLKEGDCLLLGHHHDDQAETVLLRLFRGAGARGLSAIPAERMLGSGRLLRPLLDVSREYIQAYAKQHSLTWVDDESNQEVHYDRNFLRHSVLPELQQRWPSVTETLVKTARRMSQTDDLLEDLARMDLASLGERSERHGVSVDFTRLRTLLVSSSQARVNNILRYWCQSLGYPTPYTDHLNEVIKQFFSSDALLGSACVTWKQTELRQFNGRLYLSAHLGDFTAPESLTWNGEQDLDLLGAGRLSLMGSTQEQSTCLLSTGDVLNTHASLVLPKANYTIRWRKGGERSTPTYRQHSQTVKKLLQEYKLETWLRDRVPLIFYGDDLYAIGDLWVDKSAMEHVFQCGLVSQTRANEEAIAFRWEI